VHQPGDYLAAVGHDLVRFAAPPRGASESDLLTLLDHPGYEAFSVPVMRAYYDERSLTRSGSVDGYAHGVHTTGPVIALLVLSALAAVMVCRERERIGAMLFAAVGLILLLTSVATATYQPRYALPAIAPLASAAALATSALVGSLSSWAAHRAAATRSPRRR
jgi:heme A synthase